MTKRLALTAAVVLLNPLAWLCVFFLAGYSRIDLAARRARV